MSLEAIDHETRALALLPQQFQDKTNVRAFLANMLGPCQDLEDCLIAMSSAYDIETATGAQLTQIGKLVGQARQGLADETYRRYVKARIRANKSNGTVSDLLTVTYLVLDVEVTTIELEFSGTAAVVIRYLDTVVSDELAQLLSVKFHRAAKAAGVRVIFESTPIAIADMLVLDTGALDTKKLINATD